MEARAAAQRPIATPSSLVAAVRSRGGFVDLHCHVLPGVDDGAADLADSLAMVAQATADGVAVICATPHIRADHDVAIGAIEANVARLGAAVRDAGMPVSIVSGGEVAAARSATLTDDELRAVSLGGSGAWVLLEPRPGAMDDALEESVDALRARGFGSVIAHPERHAGADAAERLAGLAARGALVQVTAALLVDHPAAPTMLAWAQQGLVHFVGSDAHAARIGRSATVSSGLAALAGVRTAAPHLDWIARDGPLAVLRGDAVVPPY